MGVFKTALVVCFAVIVFGTVYRWFDLSDPKDLIFLFGIALTTGWIFASVLIYGAVRSSRNR